MDKNADNKQQVTTVKREWHAPELRKYGAVERTGYTEDEPECS